MIPTVLLIEDDPTHSSHITDHLRGADPACRVIAVTSAHSASDFLQREKADCALLDYALPDANGLDFLAEILQRRPGLPVIIVTAAGSEEVAVSAMKLGAADYVVKHGRYLSNVARAVADVLSGRDLPPPAARLRQVPDLTEELKRIARRSTGDPFRDILGTSPALQGVKDRVRRFAGSDETILVDGETGTGKELVARAIHRAGPRADQPFVTLNCAAVPEGLLENELFGHARGAFTGADRDRPGLFAAASKGSLFLDELGELPLSLQPKLLRVLESGDYRPLRWHSRGNGLRVRIIAATNRDLRSSPSPEGSFRSDLYYRLQCASLSRSPHCASGARTSLSCSSISSPATAPPVRPTSAPAQCAS